MGALVGVLFDIVTRVRGYEQDKEIIHVFPGTNCTLSTKERIFKCLKSVCVK